MAKIPYKAIVKRLISHFPVPPEVNADWSTLRRPPKLVVPDNLAEIQYWAPDGIYVDADETPQGRVVAHIHRTDLNYSYRTYTHGDLALGQRICPGINWRVAYPPQGAAAHAVVYFRKKDLVACVAYMDVVDDLIGACRSLLAEPAYPIPNTPRVWNWRVTADANERYVVFNVVGPVLNSPGWSISQAHQQQQQEFIRVHSRYALLTHEFQQKLNVPLRYSNPWASVTHPNYTQIAHWILELPSKPITSPDFQPKIDAVYAALATVIRDMNERELALQTVASDDPGAML